MSIQLLFRQITGNIPAEKFWVGFVARFMHTVDSKSVPGCRALEISSLGLSVAEEKRVREGFSFPFDLWLRNRPDKTVAPRLYVGIEEPKSVFTEQEFLESIDFVFAAKGDATLSDLQGATTVTVFRPEHPNGLTMDIFQSHSDARAVRFPVVSMRHNCREFADASPLTVIADFNGDIEDYCEQHANRLLALVSPALLSLNPPAPQPPLKIQQPAPQQPAPQSPPKTQQPTPNAPSSPVRLAPSSPLQLLPQPSPWKKIVWVCVALLAGIGWFANPWQTGVPIKPVRTTAQSIPALGGAREKPPADAKPIAAEQFGNTPGGVGSLPAATQGIDIPPVPHTGKTISREQLAALGYPEHLAKVKFAIASAKAKDFTGIDQSRDWLKVNKQIAFLPENDQEAKQVRVGRRYFNEAIEKKIINGQEKKDNKELQEVIVHLNDYLLENFGSANAHLNLAVAYIESDQSKFALAPAFHTIVFNPEGANGWFQLGLVLAINGETENGAAAMCVTLHIAKYSEKTLGLFNRIEQGLIYAKPNVKEALAQTRTMCPGTGWS